MKYKFVGYTRDSLKGKVIKRHLNDVCNSITSSCGGAVRKAHIFIMNTSYKIVEMWGSLQAHHSVIRGGMLARLSVLQILDYQE